MSKSAILDVLNLSDKMIMYAMVALDTEMNQLHNLGIEQGLFFKSFFPGAVSDSDRYNLKEHAPRQTPHASHLDRNYWKSTIFITEIINIRIKHDQMFKSWLPIYNTLSELKVKPEMPSPKKWNPLQETSLFEFHMNFFALMKSIIDICQWIENRHMQTSSVRKADSFPNGSKSYVQPMIAPLEGLLDQLKTTM